MLKTVLKLFRTPTAVRAVETGRCYATFRNRDFTFESSDGEGVGNLITQFARHVVIKQAKTDDLVKYQIRYADYFPVSDWRGFVKSLSEVPNDDLSRMLVFASVFRSRSEIPIFVQVINQLDNECASRVDQLNPRQMIEILNAFMYMLPNRMAQLDFYRLAMQRLVDGFDQFQSVDDFVKVVFYLGLWKRRGSNLIDQFMRNHLKDYVQEFSTMDFAIVVNAAFKASVRVNIGSFRERVIEEVNKAEDLGHLITFLKSCRMNNIKSSTAMDRIRQGVKKNEFAANGLTAYAHIFSFVAENLVDDKFLNDYFVQDGFNLIQHDSRPKDISTFLWSCAHLGLEIDSDTLLKIDKILHKKVYNDEYKYMSDELTSVCLSLFLLGHSTQLAQDIEVPHRKTPERTRLDSRKMLLFKCLEIEAGKKQPKAKAAPSYLINNKLKQVQEIVGGEMVLAVEELNIAGISNYGTFYEVLDESNTTSNGVPYGMMKLKLKLMKKLEYNVKVINTLNPHWQEELE